MVNQLVLVDARVTWDAIRLIGLEGLCWRCTISRKDCTRLMAFLRDDHLQRLDWFEQAGLLTLNNEDDYVGSGSVGYIGEGHLHLEAIYYSRIKILLRTLRNRILTSYSFPEARFMSQHHPLFLTWGRMKCWITSINGISGVLHSKT